MKIAYLILCHKDPEHIDRLVKKVTVGTDNIAFIHVDAKSDASLFKKRIQDNKQAVFLQKRTDVRWGGYSSVLATITLMEEALNYGQFDRFVILQGLDYPIKSNAEIDAFFSENADTEFIRAQNLSQQKDPKKVYKYRLYHFLDQKHKIFYGLLQKANGLFIKLRVIPHFKRNYALDQKGNKYDIFQGCAHFGLTRKAVEYIVDFHRQNPRFNRYFKTMYTVDEAYFHTILFNSPFIKNTVEKKATTRPRLIDFMNLTYFEYPDQVVVFKKAEDYAKLEKTGYLYFRKASSESKELLDYIDAIHGSKEKI